MFAKVHLVRSYQVSKVRLSEHSLIRITNVSKDIPDEVVD